MGGGLSLDDGGVLSLEFSNSVFFFNPGNLVFSPTLRVFFLDDGSEGEAARSKESTQKETMDFFWWKKICGDFSKKIV